MAEELYADGKITRGEMTKALTDAECGKYSTPIKLRTGDKLPDSDVYAKRYYAKC